MRDQMHEDRSLGHEEGDLVHGTRGKVNFRVVAEQLGTGDVGAPDGERDGAVEA